jgi:hypothetical protein
LPAWTNRSRLNASPGAVVLFISCIMAIHGGNRYARRGSGGVLLNRIGLVGAAGVVHAANARARTKRQTLSSDISDARFRSRGVRFKNSTTLHVRRRAVGTWARLDPRRAYHHFVGIDLPPAAGSEAEQVNSERLSPEEAEAPCPSARPEP